jgi:hypothetical protein
MTRRPNWMASAEYAPGPRRAIAIRSSETTSSMAAPTCNRHQMTPWMTSPMAATIGVK